MGRKRTIGMMLGIVVVVVFGIFVGHQLGLLGGDTPAEASLTSPATATSSAAGTGAVVSTTDSA